MIRQDTRFVKKDIRYIFIDLFCGFGGTTLGIESARNSLGEKIAQVIACVNHDELAIDSHEGNHPNVIHFKEDIKHLAMKRLKRVVAQAKKEYPNALVVVWASLECTNFSIAKGGMEKDADSRTLAMHLFRYIDAINPDYVQIENVREFKTWGKLYKCGKRKGKPIPSQKGKLYRKWVNKLKHYRQKNRFEFSEAILNSADYGEYTSRKRLFLCFSRPGLPNMFPQATHSKYPERFEKGKYKKWKKVRDVLDLEDKGKSIFFRKKDLAEATLKRILAGLTKWGAGGDESFMQKYYSGKPENMVFPLDQPAGAITCKDHHSLVFMDKYYGNSTSQSIDNPLGALTTKDRNQLVTAEYLDVYYSGSNNHRSLDQPCGTLTTNNKFNLVQCEHFLMNPQWKSKGSSIDDPCFTLIARMDKAPPSIISLVEGKVAIKVYPSDSPTMRKIKAFMAYYGIMDIKTRMLKVIELLRIQGFPEDYYSAAKATQTKKFIGNSVVPIIPKLWIECMYNELVSHDIRQIA